MGPKATSNVVTLEMDNTTLSLAHTAALVLAGGRGSRLHGLSRQRCKPAVNFGTGLRMVDFALSNCANSGVHEVGVVCQYQQQSLLRHLALGWQGSWAPSPDLNVKELPSGTTPYVGTADAIYRNLDWLQQQDARYVLVLAGDHVYSMDYRPMLKQHIDRGCDITIGAVECPLEDATEFGVIGADEQGQIQSFQEKPAVPQACHEGSENALVSMGIYIFSIDFLQTALQQDEANRFSAHDIGRNIIPAAINDTECFVYHFCKEGKPQYWRDVGTLDSYFTATQDLVAGTYDELFGQPDWPLHSAPGTPKTTRILSGNSRRIPVKNCLLGNGVTIDGASLRHSVIGDNCVISTDSIVNRTVLLPNVRIGSNCSLVNCIVDEACIIPDGTHIGLQSGNAADVFHVTENGVILVTQEAIDTLLDHTPVPAKRPQLDHGNSNLQNSA